MIFCRGTAAGTGTGTYFLQFTDGPAGLGCSSGTVDTTLDCFVPGACASGVSLYPSSYGAFNFTPHIVENLWYTVVATFNDTVYKVYVNGTLMNTIAITSPGNPMGVSTDSASIGNCIYSALTGYPYYFKGIMDDILLYNRVLTDTEIVHLTDTCGTITSIGGKTKRL